VEGGGGAAQRDWKIVCLLSNSLWIAIAKHAPFPRVLERDRHGGWAQTIVLAIEENSNPVIGQPYFKRDFGAPSCILLKPDQNLSWS
jgi:hypothetical protein